MSVKYVIDLMKAVAENGITEFEMEHGELRLVMKRRQEGKKQAGEETGSSVSVFREEKKEEGKITETGNLIKCPLVGTFYTAPSPEAENFVQIGDRVKKGQVIGIVEGMKLMNEIESEFDGVVEAVLAENETVVEYGQPLFRIV